MDRGEKPIRGAGPGNRGQTGLPANLAPLGPSGGGSELRSDGKLKHAPPRTVKEAPGGLSYSIRVVEAAFGGDGAGFGNLGAQYRHFVRKLARASRRFAAPERDARCGAVGIF